MMDRSGAELIFEARGYTLQWRHNERDGVSNHQLTIVYSAVHQRKYQSSASQAFARELSVNSPHTKGQ